MKVIYRSDGCIDFQTTKAVSEGTAISPKELEELNLSYSSKDLDVDWLHDGSFWDNPDPKWSEPLFPPI